MYLSNYGEIVQKWWVDIPVHFPDIETGAFVIMPNHIHGVIFITGERRGEVLRVSPLEGKTSFLRKPTLGQIIAYFKYQSTKELKQKTDYILDNPSRWDPDQENPINKKSPGL